MNHMTRVGSEAELDEFEKPVRDAFAAFLADEGLLYTGETLMGLTFRTGGLHFAAKALEFIPRNVKLIVAGTNLSAAELECLASYGRPVFNSTNRYDNELVYEMLMACSGGAFGWVDADCFVLNPSIWDGLFAPFEDDVGAHTAFTYDPLGFAKSVLVVFGGRVKELLRAERTTLNSYAAEPTNVGRAAPHSISRLLQDNHWRYLKQILGTDAEGGLQPHDGLLDIFDNGRTVNTRKRSQLKQWFGPEVKFVGPLVDTPMMADIVLRANGFKTRRLIDSNREVSQDIVHVGASSYRERMRQEGASQTYLARFKLTDLFEVLLAEELAAKGGGDHYTKLAEAQRQRLRDEAGVNGDEIKPIARSMLSDHGIDLAPLSSDHRLQFLF
jgi:hypothetical protein